MIKNVLLLFFVCSFATAQAQVIANIKWQAVKPADAVNMIHYDGNQKLIWPDFKGTPDASSFAAAITQSGFGYQLAMQSLNSKVTINITVYCYFDKNKSWVKKGMNSDYALLHEQHHFDITYINTCLFIEKLKDAKFTRANYKLLSGKIYDECIASLEKMQNQYDGETSNGRKPAVQAVWNKKIDQQLAALATN